MLAETFLIYSALPTQIFLDCLYVVIGPSISTKTMFRFCCSFSNFTNISSSFTLLIIQLQVSKYIVVYPSLDHARSRTKLKRAKTIFWPLLSLVSQCVLEDT